MTKKTLEIIVLVKGLPWEEYELFRIFGFYVMADMYSLYQLICVVLHITDQIRPKELKA